MIKVADALPYVIRTEEGRAVLGWLLEELALYGASVWRDDSSRRDWLLGRQSVACDVVARIKSIDPELWIEYQKLTLEDKRNG